MADDQSTQQAREQMAIAQLQQMTEKVIELGREEYSAEGFDMMSREVVDAIGTENISVPSWLSLVHCDAPTRIVERLSENPELAKSLAGMSQARRASGPRPDRGGVDASWQWRRGGAGMVCPRAR